MSHAQRSRVPVTFLALAALVGCESTPNRPVRSDSRPIAAAPKEAVIASDEGAAGGSARPGAADAVSPGAGVLEPADLKVSWPQEVSGGSDAVVVVVGGREVGVGELLSRWMMRDPAGVRGLLDDLILARLVLLEAGALGLEPPAKEVERLVNEHLDSLESKAKAAGAPDLATFIEARQGLKPDPYLRQLNEEVAIDTLASRCVRAWLLSSDRREVRAITVEGRSGADEVQARLARGEAFDSIARDVSTDGTSEQGGRVTPVVRGDSVLARVAFATEVGSRAGPIQEGENLLFVQVEAAPAVLEGTWAEVGAAVEASLRAQPVEDPEFWQWKAAMVRRYDVDTGPFLELIQ